MKKYKLFISALPKAIIYHVSEYETFYKEKEQWIRFYDEMTDPNKEFPIETPTTGCIIREVQ